MRTVGLRPTSGTLLAAALALAIAGCALFEPEPDGTFSVVIAARDHVDPLAVDVIDRTGTVTAVIVAEGPFREGVVAGPDDPATLIVTWMGGMCDVRTTLTLEPTLDAMRISEATEARAGVCRMAGIRRSIAIRFEPPLAPEFVELART
jgi:hypothetical protein